MPSCVELDTMLGEPLREFAGDLHRPNSRMHTQFTENTQIAQGLTCTIAFDDPMPRGDSYPAAAPMARFVAIKLRATGESPTNWQLLRRSVEPDSIELGRVGEPTRLAGVGDDAVSWAARTYQDALQVRVRSRVSNIEFDVTTSGMDWSGGVALPLSDAPNLSADLSVGAEKIATALARGLPITLPLTTIGWTLQPAAPERDDTPVTRAPVPVWDPCTIPDSALLEAGLDPASRESRGSSESEEHSCHWEADGFSVHVDSTAQGFRETVYGAERYTGFRPVTVGGRPSLILDSTSHGDRGCGLGFDAPQGEKYSGTVGMVEMNAWIYKSIHRREMSRDALCAALTRVAGALVQHLPPDRG